MKKLILSLALLCAAFCYMNAQDVSSLPKAARLAYEWLSEEGYRPYVDEDGDVSFKAQGYFLYIDADEDSQNYLQLVMPAIKNIDVDSEDSILETYCALAACNEMTRDKKIVKAYMSDSGKVSLSCETYIDDTPLVGNYLEKAISFIIRVCEQWRESYNDYMED
jgi:hypothetical protein